MNFGNVYGVLSNAIILLIVAMVVIIINIIKIRRYEREIAELEYELYKYKQYDDEEKRTEDDFTQSMINKYGIKPGLPKCSGRYPGVKNINLSKLDKEH